MRSPVRVLVLLAALVLGACSSGGGGTASDDVDAGGEGAPSDESASGGSASGDESTTTVASGAPVPSAGCGASEEVAVQLEERTLDVDGVSRQYLLTTPSAHDGETPVPVVLDFHGLFEGMTVHSTMSNLSPLAESEGFVVVFPNGTGEPVRWDADPTSDPNADLAYVDALLDTLGEDLCIDTSRVYSTGLSYGAIFTSLLMCTRADRFAAVAPVAGLQDPDPCEPSRALPILTFHGTEDPILQLDGTVDLSSFMGGDDSSTTTKPPADINGPGYPAYVAAWAERNGCDPEATDTEVTPEVIHRVYDCPEGADVEFFLIVGGGHAWPGSEFSKSIETVVGPTTFDIDASAEMWEFFQRFQLPAS